MNGKVSRRRLQIREIEVRMNAVRSALNDRGISDKLARDRETVMIEWKRIAYR